MKILARIILVLVVLVVAAGLLANTLIQRYAVKTIEESTGFTVTFDDIHVGLLTPVVRIENLVLSNPPGFPHPEALNLREFYVRYNPFSFLSGPPRLVEVRLDVPRVVMVKPARGESNVEILAKSMSGKKAGGGDKPPKKDAPPAPDEKKPAPPASDEKSVQPPLIIDRLTVRFGEMEVRQYTAGQEEPMVIPVPVGLDRTYENVTNVEEVVTRLAGELVLRSGVGLVGNLDKVMEAVKGEDGKVDKEQLKQQLKGLRDMFRGKSP